MNIKTLIKGTGIPVILGMLLVACGGGSGNGTTVGTNNNKVSISKTVFSAGQSAALTADISMLNDTPTKMKWTVANITGDAHTPLVISNADCASASFSAATTSANIGTGRCLATLTIPNSLSDGTWKITNTATSATGSISDSVDISVSSLTPSGFRIIESSIPVSSYIGILTRLTTQFTVNPGYTASNIKYTWTSSAENTTPLQIIGSHNSSPSVTPDTAGLYKFNVVISADINGTTETANGTIFLSVAAQNTVDIVQAGAPQIVTTGAVVNLVGEINAVDGMQYAYAWSQVTTAAVPAVVNILNANAANANFVAPDTVGTYGFKLTVTKTLPDGTTMLSSAQTSVVVTAKPTPVFGTFAGNTQTINSGVVANLTGTVAAQNTVSGVTYAYAWTQVGVTPAIATISNANTLTASFFPTVNGTYTFNFTVTATTAEGVATASSMTQVIVGPGGLSFALSANAGLAQAVGANGVVTLTGAQTTQGVATGAIYSYAWTQIGATPATVILSTPTNLVASFTPTVDGTYSFNLAVTATLPDGTTRMASSDTQVVVGGVGTGFSVSAGDAKVQAVNLSATMPGVVTTQGPISGAVFTYAWTQVGATPAVVDISNASSLTASFIPTVAGSYTFMLSVTATQNGVGTTLSSQTQVLVTP
jgi:hypothetical protein